MGRSHIRSFSKVGVLLVCLAAQVVVVGGSANAATYVYPGPAPCDTTLQDCITGVPAGSIVRIAQNERIDESIGITKSLTLEAARGFQPVLGGELGSPNTVSVQNPPGGDETDVVIRGLILRHNRVHPYFYDGTGHSFKLLDSKVTLEMASNNTPAVEVTANVPTDVTLRNNVVKSTATGLRVQSSADPMMVRVEQNEVSGLDPDYDFAGIQVSIGSLSVGYVQSNLVRDTLVYGISATADAESSMHVNNNTIDDVQGSGISLSENGDGTFFGLFNNSVSHVGTGVTSTVSSSSILRNGYNNFFATENDNEFGPYSAGPHTTTFNPRFRSRANDDYRLTKASKLVHGGLTCNSSSLSGADLDGRARVDRQIVDIGAYERKAPAKPFSTVRFGSPGPNDFTGGAKRDLFCGFAGKDEAKSKGASDLIIMGAGNDDATGGGSGDRLIAGAGDDVISGEAGGDVLKGRDGVRNNDTVQGGPGPDKCTADRRDTISSC